MSEHRKTAKDVIKQEQDMLKEQLQQHLQKKSSGISEDNIQLPHYALALSGGGIRSASFAIGVIQALKSDKLTDGKTSVFDKLSYLSTASGGGYSGASLTWYQKKFGFFPFGNATTFNGSQYNQDKENTTLNYIRQNGKYLTPNELGVSGFIGSVLLSVLHSITAYTLIMSLLLILLMFAATAEVFDSPLPSFIVDLGKLLLGGADTDQSLNSSLYLQRLYVFGSNFLLLITVAAIFSFTILLYGLSSFIKQWLAQQYAFRINTQKFLGWQIRALLLTIVLALLPIVCHYIYALENLYSMGYASISSILGILLSFKKMKSEQDNEQSPGPLSNLISSAIVISLIFVFLVTAYLLAEHLIYHDNSQLLLAICLGVVVSFLVNTNQISPHKMYRDRLMETFLKDPDVTATASLHERGKQANEYLMSELASDENWTPYHLINTNVILNNASHPKFRGRMGDSFILSPLFCGSDATGYVKTTKFIDGKLTLSTAISISGAALNPHAGVSGIGKTTNSQVSYLLSFLGLRLGYWVFNPARANTISKMMRPNYIFPGLANLLNFGHREDSQFVELSDGGHFDNTGLYELVRRRLSVIIFSDGTADQECEFEDFGNAVERIRVDFGVRIKFSNIQEFDLHDMLPGSLNGTEQNPEDNLYKDKYKLSKRGYALGDIIYPTVDDQEGFVGKLIYIKAVLIDNLPRDLYAYRAVNPEFPNQPTSDQFFDERQFESYRELGYQLTKSFLQNPEAMKYLS